MAGRNEPQAYYRANDGVTKMPCSLIQAQFWLCKGHFTSTTMVALVEKDGSEGVWRSVDEWIQRDGREMPFTEWMTGEEERKEEDEELRRLHEEHVELKKATDKLEKVLAEAKERRATIRMELLQIEQKYPDGRKQPLQPNSNANASTSKEPVKVVKEESVKAPSSQSSSTPSPPPSDNGQIVPKKGVDPFALLKSCYAVKKKLPGDIVANFNKLRTKFDRCDKKLLVQQTKDVFAGNYDDREVPRCALCRVNITSTNNLIDHLCGTKHVMAMKGEACADAYDFWMQAIESVTTPDSNPFGSSGPSGGFSTIGRSGQSGSSGFDNGGFGAQQGFGGGFESRPDPGFGSRPRRFGN